MIVEEIIDGLIIKLKLNGGFNKARRLLNRNDILYICPGFITITIKEQDGFASWEDKISYYIIYIAHFSV